MTSYFEAHASKASLSTNAIFNADGSRTDLLLEQYELSKTRLVDDAKATAIDDMYMKWCDLLFGGFNVVVLGAQSKYSLLETFKKRYLDSDAIPDFRTATGFNSLSETSLFQSAILNDTPEPGEPTSAVGTKSSRQKTSTAASKSKSKSTRPSRRVTRRTPSPIESVESSRQAVAATPLDFENCPMLDIVTVRLHGLDHLKAEAFNHAVFDIKESRKPKEEDIREFLRSIQKANQHYVFLIHSFENFFRECEEICHTIFRLYSLDPIHIHLLMSSDELNAGKKLNNLKIRLRLAFFAAPFSESFFREKTELMNEFDELGDAADGAANETNTVHRLFNERTDLQSLKDIYQALDSATASIMRYIFRDYVQKCAANEAAGAEEEPAPAPWGQAEGAEGAALEEQNRMQPKRQAKARGEALRSRAEGGRARPKRAKKIETYLEFNHLLKHCESRFIIRRGAALRDHLGELKDHRIVSDDEPAGNKIRCLIERRLCAKFLDWVGVAEDD